MEQGWLAESQRHLPPALSNRSRVSLRLECQHVPRQGPHCNFDSFSNCLLCRTSAQCFHLCRGCAPRRHRLGRRCSGLLTYNSECGCRCGMHGVGIDGSFTGDRQNPVPLSTSTVAPLLKPSGRLLVDPPTVCGIFGYYNHRVARSRSEILDCLLTGLKRLEYRGYDSAGICVDAQPAGTYIEDAQNCNVLANGNSVACGPGEARGALPTPDQCAASKSFMGSRCQSAMPPPVCFNVVLCTCTCMQLC